MAHFNVLLGRLLLWLLFAGAVFSVGLSELLAAIGVCRAPAACDKIAFPVAILGLASAVIWDGSRRQLSPVLRRPDRTILYTIGHILVGIANLVLAMSFVFGPVAAFITSDGARTLLVLWAIPAIVPYALGAFLINMSKASSAPIVRPQGGYDARTTRPTPKTSGPPTRRTP